MGGMRGGRHGDWRSSKQSREKKKRKIIAKSVMSIVTEELTCTHILKEIMQRNWTTERRKWKRK